MSFDRIGRRPDGPTAKCADGRRKINEGRRRKSQNGPKGPDGLKSPNGPAKAKIGREPEPLARYNWCRQLRLEARTVVGNNRYEERLRTKAPDLQRGRVLGIA
ncbi:hypothetical protein SUTMEG_13140 [Sutterella megalosphaeroides]|uniref:Uncharacterized protein n=1 Tax=Sutterella megalosphaeroides TaxID=2494234 RepID=A0A2Z6IA73_9BURK|nr:hypothetical protein SUTMEG_13140 [Sutterella megalosphaeroides]